MDCKNHWNFISLASQIVRMQKLITIPILAFYVLASLGLHGVSHFCGNEFMGIALYNPADEMDCGKDVCCQVPDKEKDNECCVDVEFSFFYESEKPLTLANNRFLVKAPSFPLNLFIISEVQVSPDQIGTPIDHDAPDEASSPPLYLQHQSLIFYG